MCGKDTVKKGNLFNNNLGGEVGFCYRGDKLRAPSKAKSSKAPINLLAGMLQF